jgi:predicted Ser/Thr protein kinase
VIKRIGDYEIRFEIGRGGFGRVYQGFDPRVERLVAIKVLNTEADASLVTRFRTEASAAGNLHHKNIVTVYGYGEDEGHHYIVMEYLDGNTLQDLIQKGNTLTLLDRVEIMTQVAEGLLCAHQNGVVHRDVKPGNIMVMANENVKIMDFGIARVLRDGATRLTQSGFLVGTIAYMAPEQFSGGSEVDALCDIWAYGVIYYELLTGVNPFWADDPGTVMYQITSRDPDPVRDRCPECPPALERVVNRLLSKDRETRYQTLEDVQFDVIPLLQQLQRSQAAALVGEAASLLHKQRLEEAAALTRKILDLDPSNAEARQLREAIQEEMRQRAIRPRVAALMRQAETEAERRNYVYALRAVESALRLTPGDAAIRHYQVRLQATIERVEEATRSLARARAEVDAADLTAALQTVTSALKADPDHPEARAFLEQIRAAIEERDRQERLRHELNRAEVLLDLSALHEASALLDRLASENPDSTDVRALIERLQRDRKEHERRRRINEELTAARKTLKESGPASAIAHLENLAQEFPAEDEVLALLAETREEQRRQELEREKALRLEGELQGCRRMRLEGRLDQAAVLVEMLGKQFGDSGPLVEERNLLSAAMAVRNRERTIEDALQQGQERVEAGEAAVAVQIVQRALNSVGRETRLNELLIRATAAQKEAERLKDIETRLAKAVQLEAESQWDAALTVLVRGLELHGAVPEMEAAAARIGKFKGIADYKRQIEQLIRDHQWIDAREMIGPAAASYPEENSAWREMEDRISAGAIQEEIENALASRDLDRAAAKLAEAHQSVTPLPAIGELEARLEELRFRQQKLDQSYSLTGQGDHAAAEAALQELLQRRPSDGEANALLKTVRERREQQEREARREQSRAEARDLVTQERFDEAIRLLRTLMKEFAGDGGLKDDLASAMAAAKAAKERAEREATLARGLAEARELVTKGDLRAATRKFQSLAKQFPEDPEVQREGAAAEEAREARKREQAREEGRKKAQKLVGDRKFDDAIELLRPLLQESPGDREMQECWRAAMEGKGRRADWLEVYETLSELEDLYKKGKARAVYQRARKLLEQVEEPRARELFKWAESMLPQEGASGLLTRLQHISRQQLLVAAAVVALLVIVLLATRCGR